MGRPLPENAKITPWPEIPWEKIDLGYAVTIGSFREVIKKNKPCVFHIDQVPQEWDNPKWLKTAIDKNPVVYWSKEEAEMWDVGISIVRPHPIDTEIFKEYNPIMKKAITIATRSISSWGQELKGYRILKDAYYQLPLQVIAKYDKDFPNAKNINSEEEMVKALQEHQTYFNCAWKLDRSPLEAMGCGMPVVALKTNNNTYLDIPIGYQQLKAIIV